MKKFPVAIQLYSVRDFAEKDLKGTLKALKEMGYDGVEFAGLYGHAPEEVKAMVEEIGLVPVSAHVTLDELLNNTPAAVARYETIGCRYIAIPWLAADRHPGNPRYEETVGDIAKIATIAKRHGITLLYHNHDTEFKRVDGVYELDMMYTDLPADLLQTELDTCWVNVGGEDPAAYLRKYSGRSPVVHLKDFVGEKSANMYELIGDDTAKAEPKTFELRPVGSGKQNFPAIIEASEEAGASWLVVEQDSPSCDMTSMECAASSREYLKSIGQ